MASDGKKAAVFKGRYSLFRQPDHKVTIVTNETLTKVTNETLTKVTNEALSIVTNEALTIVTNQTLRLQLNSCVEMNDVLLVEYLVFTRVPGESYRRRLRSLLLCSCEGFPTLCSYLLFLLTAQVL